MLFGILLVFLGGTLFGASDLPIERRWTALIPAFVGILLIACGVIGRNDKARKHAMHLAAMIALLGGVGGLVQGTRGLFSETPKPLAITGSYIMAGLCAAFVALCVRSFIAARKARKQAEAGS
jgi:uncharacterized membrane protein